MQTRDQHDCGIDIGTGAAEDLLTVTAKSLTLILGNILLHSLSHVVNVVHHQLRLIIS